MLANLPLELLHEIVLCFGQDLGDVARLNRCSKVLHEATSATLYLRCTIDIQSHRFESALITLDGIAKRHTLVRELKIVSSGRNGMCSLHSMPDQSLQVCEKISTAIDSATGLESFQWQISNIFPALSIIRSLSLKTTLRSLNIGFVRDNDKQVFQLPRSSTLPTSGLYSMAVRADRYESFPSDFASVLRLLRGLLLSSPALKILRTDGSLLHNMTEVESGASGGTQVVIYPQTLELLFVPRTGEMQNYDDIPSDFLLSNPKHIVNVTMLENLIIQHGSSFRWIPVLTGINPRQLRSFHCRDSSGTRHIPAGYLMNIREFLLRLKHLEHFSAINSTLGLQIGRDALSLSDTLRSINVHMLARWGTDWLEKSYPLLQSITVCLYETDILFSFKRLPLLRSLRFAYYGTDDLTPTLTDQGLNTVLEVIKIISKDTDPDAWPKLELLCMLYQLKEVDYVRAWKRDLGDKSWRSQADEFTRATELDKGCSIISNMTQYHAWDQSLVNNDRV